MDDPNVQLEEMDFQDFEACEKSTPQTRSQGLLKMLNPPIEPSFHDSYGRVEAVVGRDLEGFGR